MRYIAEILGICLILLGAYMGGRALWDRLVYGPKAEETKRKIRNRINRISKI